VASVVEADSLSSARAPALLPASLPASLLACLPPSPPPPTPFLCFTHITLTFAHSLSFIFPALGGPKFAVCMSCDCLPGRLKAQALVDLRVGAHTSPGCWQVFWWCRADAAWPAQALVDVLESLDAAADSLRTEAAAARTKVARTAAARTGLWPPRSAPRSPRCLRADPGRIFSKPFYFGGSFFLTFLFIWRFHNSG
jgi:hypothetical protein